MWSDQPDPAQHAQWIAAIRRVLSAPDPRAVPSIHALSPGPAPAEVAALLRDAPGFIWLDGGNTRHLLLSRPLATISSDGERVTVRGPADETSFAARSLDGLSAALDAWSGASGALLAGWIGYEVAGELERLDFAPHAGEALPRLHFALYDTVLAFDDDGWSLTETNAWTVPSRAGQARELLRKAAEAAPEIPPEFAMSAGDTSHLAQGRAAFLDGVARIVRRIHAGDLFQTNLCRHLRVPLTPELAWPLYLRMRALSPATHGAYIRVNERQSILSVSPETFLTLRDGHVESLPIKGTRPRGATGEEDARMKDELLASDKDRAELAMVVDVTRNDLSRVCVPGTVRVAEHASLMTLPTLHHTYSRVTGRLRDGVGAADLLRAAFPPASITGAPKIAAMEAAYREERQSRGPCMGAIGWISLDGATELSVAIRTAYTTGGEVVYLAGCGITAESDPAAELAESEAKARAFLSALGAR